jgi:hypothetical protein
MLTVRKYMDNRGNRVIEDIPFLPLDLSFSENGKVTWGQLAQTVTRTIGEYTITMPKESYIEAGDDFIESVYPDSSGSLKVLTIDKVEECDYLYLSPTDGLPLSCDGKAGEIIFNQ